jgi:hypothetical protein
MLTNMRAQEIINFLRGIHEQMRIWKESNMFNLVNQQSPKINKGERKEQTVFDYPGKKPKNIETRKCLSIITLNVNDLYSPIKSCRLAY